MKRKFNKGNFLQHIDPYPGESEMLVVDFDYNETGDFHGYKCAVMKGKHCKEHDFENHIIIDIFHEDSYKVVG